MILAMEDDDYVYSQQEQSDGEQDEDAECLGSGDVAHSRPSTSEHDRPPTKRARLSDEAVAMDEGDCIVRDIKLSGKQYGSISSKQLENIIAKELKGECCSALKDSSVLSPCTGTHHGALCRSARANPTRL